MSACQRSRPTSMVWRAGAVCMLACLTLAIAFASAAWAADPAWKSEWPRTDFSRHNVRLTEIFSGGPRKDGIPAIDKPQFVTPPAAAKWLPALEPVIALEILHGDGQ